ncbi:hypothetical protein ACFRMN_22960 [Streptomyces sp. NPDC056835]|uniref:hypothetical protein n=1 Tax=Streptomyces sp. NPDC056835 TaxID=3345956 RepID=UPI0036D11ECE
MPDEDREGRDQRRDQVEAEAEAEAREADQADGRDVTRAETPEETRADARESEAERRRRRAQFLRELNEAKALRERVKPRQARAARMRQQMRMRTFRW